jgi:DNA-binding NarL/FixJ family response regulator
VKKLRVFLADDHPVLRGGLRGLIDAQPDMEVVGEAGDGAAAVRGVVESLPDVAILDVSMPVLSGSEVAAQVRAACPGVKVLALTAHENLGYVRQMLQAGAAGYVRKRAAAEELVRAVRAVAQGQHYLDPDLAHQLATTLVGVSAAGAEAAGRLSEREDEVLRLIAQGHPLKHIASRLDVTVRTVETYRARAMEKLGLKHRADIIRHAIQCGWLKDG